MKRTEFSDNITDEQFVNEPVESFTAAQEGEHESPSDDNMAEVEGETGDNSASVTAAEPDTEWKDKYLRLSAEFDNYRKRTLREKMELIASGGEDIVKALLPVLDDMERARDAFATAIDMTAMKDGFDLIFRKLHDILSGRGLTEISAMGHEMDAELFEAVAMVAGKPKERGKVIDVVQKGYRMKDKVIRHAKVVVGD